MQWIWEAQIDLRVGRPVAQHASLLWARPGGVRPVLNSGAASLARAEKCRDTLSLCRPDVVAAVAVVIVVVVVVVVVDARRQFVGRRAGGASLAAFAGLIQIELRVERRGRMKSSMKSQRRRKDC